MSTLIDSLFPKSKADAIRSLWLDVECRPLIQKEIAKELLNDHTVIELPLTQIMFISSLSTFADSEKECYDVAEIIYWGITKTDVFPLISEHKGKELAYRCLISLSLFKEALNKKYERHGAPSPDFYRKVGISSFEQIEMKEISHHFRQWEGFIGEFFV